MGALVPWNGGRSWVAARPTSQEPSTWKVIRIDPAIVPAVLGPDPYGVVISSDDMLARTHTMWFCPLIEGLDQAGSPTTIEPWHVEVQLELRANQIPPSFKNPRLSTKVVFAAMPDEVDKDRKEHGRLDAKSRARASELLKKWLPLLPGRT